LVALGLADISVVQPLNGFGLAVLALFSRWYLGERLTPAMLAGIAAVIAGVAVIGATVAESRAPAGAGEILAAYTNGLPALAGLVVAPLVVWAAARRAGRLTGVLYAVAAAAASVVGLTFSKGAFGLFAVVGLGAALSTWPTYALLGVMLCFSTLAMFLQQMSFQKGKAVVVTPVFAATSVVLPLLAGAVVFGERVAWLTFLAVLFIVVGVVVLGAARPAEVTDARAK
jgi:drug/metabolite transporter (DMT)-like permease